MENNRELREKKNTCMGISSMIKEAGMYNGGKIVSSTASEINMLRKLDSYMQKNQTGLFSHTMHRY